MPAPVTTNTIPHRAEIPVSYNISLLHLILQISFIGWHHNSNTGQYSSGASYRATNNRQGRWRILTKWSRWVERNHNIITRLYLIIPNKKDPQTNLIVLLNLIVKNWFVSVTCVILSLNSRIVNITFCFRARCVEPRLIPFISWLVKHSRTCENRQNCFFRKRKSVQPKTGSK